KLRTFDEWRIIVLPDHPTNIATRKHGYAPTLWGVAGSDIKSSDAKSYCEREAVPGKTFSQGHDLMPWFLSKKS
ncbi:MAG TPA: hypothetical protein PK402_10795, partial [Tepidisphaeraceae bacterium]|nr:hypothetical protein [Tepidisphaeraceae bacterium]